MWCKYILVLCLLSYASGTKFTLPGYCPHMKVQNKMDYTKFAGEWYNIASYASDNRNIYDCAIFDFLEDNIGFIMRENYIQTGDGNRTSMAYLARVDPMFNAGNQGKFIISHENNDKVLQYPLLILSTDYDKYAIAYTCKNGVQAHYVFSWILTRSKGKMEEITKIIVESVLSKYPELFEHKNSFVYKDFSEESCSFNVDMKTALFTSNFW